MATYIRREADSFVFRRRIPENLQSRFGIKELYRSLRTTVRDTAKVRAAQLFVASERLFALAEDYTLIDEDFRAAARHWMSQPRIQQWLKKNVDDLTPGMLRARSKFFPEDLLVTVLPDSDYTERDVMLEEAGYALDDAGYCETPDLLDPMISELLRTLQAYVDKHMAGVFRPEMLHTLVTETRALPSPPPTTNAKRISSFLGAWQDDITRGYNGIEPLADETTDQYLKTVEMFVGLMGDLPVGHISFETAQDFRSLVLEMPATHGKGAIRSPKQELARARADKTIPRVTMKTTKRHFSGMNSIWRWLVHKKHVPANPLPFSGHSFPGTKSKKSARDDWSIEDLQLFFKSSEYRESQGGSALHWLPLISLHSGMRLEEICRLRPTIDIVTKDMTPCFEINAREGWDPKTEAGSRIIPIHSWLLGHGLLDFVKQQRERGAEHLFSPELLLHKNKLSSGFSRDFSKLKIELGVGAKTAFHSFRHTFRTVLESTDHKESHIDAILGHEGGGSEGRTYTKRVSTAKLKQVVESFVSPLELSFLGAKDCEGSLPPIRAIIKKRKLTPPTFDANGKLVRMPARPR